MLADKQRCRTRRRMALLWACMSAMRTSTAEPAAGQFKLSHPVTVTSKRGKLHHYVIKRGASPAEVDRYNESGFSEHHRHRGCGQTDLLREVEAQELRLVDRKLIMSYVAWGWAKGVFYAVQPALDLDQPQLYDEDEDGYDDRDFPRYRNIDQLEFGLRDCDPHCWHNVGVYKGVALKCYDWGYGLDMCFHSPTFKHVSNRYKKAA